MEFAFTEEQDELRRGARRFLQNVSNTETVLKTMVTEVGHDPEVWSRITNELGWPSLIIPEQYDGIGMSYLDLHPLMEEMGRHLLCAPFFSTVCLGTNALLHAGTDEQKQTWLPQIATGKATATLALKDKSEQWSDEKILTTCTQDGSDYILNGHKAYVVDGHTADLLIVAARQPQTRGEEGVTLFAIPATTKGLVRRWTPTMDQTRKLASIELNDVRVPKSMVMLEPGAASSALQHVTDLALIALSAEQVGGAEQCLEMAVEYAGTRQQFGRPIGMFQSIKHKCADMLVKAECARSASFYASALAASGEKDLCEAASGAKTYCSEAFFFCASENIQIHGGIGFTWEHAAHLYFKRAKSSGLLLGNAAFHRERIAQRMEQ